MPGSNCPSGGTAASGGEPGVLGLEVIDAHHHLCHLSRASYPWLERPASTRYHGDDLPLRRDYLLDDYLADVLELENLGARVVGSVHVENGAADPNWEMGWLDETIRGHDVPSAQVAKVCLDSPTVEEDLGRAADVSTVRGVRDILNLHPDSTYTHRERDLLADSAWRRGFGLLAPLGLSFDLQVFSHQLRDAARLAADHGDVPIVLDHAGMPIDRSPSGLARWRRDLAVFAAEPNTAVKISALGTLDHAWTADSIRRIILETIDVFGPSRCMVASNFPVDGLYSSLGQLFSAFDDITSGLGRGDREELFAGAARRFYRL